MGKIRPNTEHSETGSAQSVRNSENTKKNFSFEELRLEICKFSHIVTYSEWEKPTQTFFSFVKLNTAVSEDVDELVCSSIIGKKKPQMENKEKVIL